MWSSSSTGKATSINCVQSLNTRASSSPAARASSTACANSAARRRSSGSTAHRFRSPPSNFANPARRRTANGGSSRPAALIQKKGLYTVLDALPQIIEKFPKVKFVLCGTGPEERKLAAEVRARGLSAHVLMPGWMNQKELIGAYHFAHVFLHPSELTASGDQEGVPNSMLEAMAAGLPVVATRHGGIPEAVRDGHDGLLVPERNAEALAGAVITLLSDPAMLRRFSRSAAVSVREKFSLDNAIAALEACYAEAIEAAAANASSATASV